MQINFGCLQRYLQKSMNILVIKHGSLGDLILSFGAIKTIRTYLSHKNLYLLTQSNYKNLFKDLPYVDSIFEDNRGNIFFSILIILRIIRRNKINLVVDLQNSNRTGLYNFFIKFFTNSKVISARAFSSFPYSQKKLGEQHITQNHADQIKLLGINKYLPPDISWMYNNNKKSENYVVIIPGASKSGASKKWPSSNYGAISNFLISKNLKIYLTGSNLDLADINQIIKISPQALNKIEDSKINNFFTLCKHAKLIISNDTGPAHIAGLTNTPMIWLANESKTSNSCYPLGENVHKLICKDIKDIALEEVIQKINELL